VVREELGAIRNGACKYVIGGIGKPRGTVLVFLYLIGKLLSEKCQAGSLCGFGVEWHGRLRGGL